LNLGAYVTKCNLGLGFLWKFNVVLGLCGLKKLRRENKASGLKRERDERDLTLKDLKPFFVGDGKNLGDHWL
jgi:hypothetical protein